MIYQLLYSQHDLDMIFSPVWAKMVSDLTLDVTLVVSADEKIDDAVGGDDEGNDDNDNYLSHCSSSGS